jgi:uncharacterized protein YciI
MKKIITAILLFSCQLVFAQNQTPAFNKSLADSLGADKYGMKMYVMVILKTGTATITDKATVDSLFKGHMDNIGHLADKGKLIVAGPFQKNDKQYRGIFILNTKSLEEAKTLLQTDPAIKANLLDTEIFNWYGSAALPLYLKYHPEVTQQGH